MFSDQGRQSSQIVRSTTSLYAKHKVCYCIDARRKWTHGYTSVFPCKNDNKDDNDRNDDYELVVLSMCIKLLLFISTKTSKGRVAQVDLADSDIHSPTLTSPLYTVQSHQDQAQHPLDLVVTHTKQHCLDSPVFRIVNLVLVQI